MHRIEAQIMHRAKKRKAERHRQQTHKQNFISLCCNKFISPLIVQEDLKNHGLNWQRLLIMEIEKFINENY